MANDKDNRTDTASNEKLDALHERVNDMLDLPLPDESEVWSLRLDNSVANIPPGHGSNGTSQGADSL
jgi:hypothetical protein